ncbi:MAG: DUF3617 domain-containing protein [Pseudomonadota bacterium]
MRYRLILPLCAAFTVAACGSSTEDEAATPDADAAADMADAMADGPMPQPGKYRTTAELVAFDVPGAPPEMAEMMRGAFAEGAIEATESCLTPEQANTSREDMLKNMAESNCTVSRFDMTGGRFDAALSCPTGQGMSGEVTMTGTMSETGTDVETSFKTQIPQAGEATIRMHMVSERIGECA